MGSEAEDIGALRKAGRRKPEVGSEEGGKDSSGGALTREQRLLIGRILVSKPLPVRPKRFRSEWLSTFGSFGVSVVLFIVWICWALARGGVRTSIIPLLAVTVVNIVMGIVVYPMIRRRAVAFIRKHEAFICPCCHYPLGSLPDEGQCPECATLYTRAQVVDMWKWSYKLKDPFPTRAVQTVSKNMKSVL